MDKYQVVLYPQAYRDLEEIYEYISCKFQSKHTAKEQTQRIRTALKSLELFPESHQERLTGRYAKKGYRQLLVDNYIVIFKIDSPNKVVKVITIQYYRRDL